MVGMEKLARLQALEEPEEDLGLLVLTLARFVTDSGERVSFDKVLRHFGLTEDDLVEDDVPAADRAAWG